jgi:hypothetical protein
MAGSAYHHMVMHLNPERLQGADYLLGERNVLAGGGGVAARMIVHQSSIRRYRVETESIFVRSRNRWGLGLGPVVYDPT